MRFRTEVWTLDVLRFDLDGLLEMSAGKRCQNSCPMSVASREEQGSEEQENEEEEQARASADVARLVTKLQLAEGDLRKVFEYQVFETGAILLLLRQVGIHAKVTVILRV